MFDPNVLERLALIALGRSAGFSLVEIALMLAPDGRSRIDRQMLAATSGAIGAHQKRASRYISFAHVNAINRRVFL